jgi:hypothetical protein
MSFEADKGEGLGVARVRVEERTLVEEGTIVADRIQVGEQTRMTEATSPGIHWEIGRTARTTASGKSNEVHVEVSLHWIFIMATAISNQTSGGDRTASGVSAQSNDP